MLFTFPIVDFGLRGIVKEYYEFNSISGSLSRSPIDLQLDWQWQKWDGRRAYSSSVAATDVLSRSPQNTE